MHILIPAIIDVRKAAPNRLHQFIRHLSKNHTITVVCINDFWKADQIDMTCHYKDFSDILSKIEVIYFTEKKISPVIQELFSPLFLQKMQNNGYDLIFNYNTLISGRFLAKKFNISMMYDIADDLSAMIQSSPQVPNLLRIPARRIGESGVRKTIAYSRSVTGTTAQIKEKYAIPDAKFHLVPNGVDTALFRKIESTVRRDLGLEDSFVLGYVGVLREWVDFTSIYQALKELQNFRLLIVGQEGYFQENKNMVQKLGIEDKVIFTGNVPYERVPDYIAAMDVCLIPFKNNEITQNAIPLKLFEYIACEKPVISSDLSGIRGDVENRIYYADTKEEYLDLLRKINLHDTNVLDLITNNRIFIEDHYTWDQIGILLEGLLKGSL
jgi:glycosyltransferase involved in cell wall biosynthesis